jgi:hypothetical protein
MATVMVAMHDRQWTQEAMHLACALARNTDSEVTVVKMLSVTHPGYLGQHFAYSELDPRDYQQVQEYRQTAEDYGVPFSLVLFQYVDLMDALVQAAEQLHADVVFATLSPSIVPYFRKFRLWNLNRTLRRDKRTLYTLEPDTTKPDWKPTITVFAGHK